MFDVTDGGCGNGLFSIGSLMWKSRCRSGVPPAAEIEIMPASERTVPSFGLGFLYQKIRPKHSFSAA